MKISLNWLKNYVQIPDELSSKELALKLTMGAVEVEGVEDQRALLDNIVVGKVVSAKKHPNADKLKVCEVSAGRKKFQVVCGGSNVREGMKVAFGMVPDTARTHGARVRWHGEGELVELKKIKIRGIESEGMICASDEIGIVEMFPKKDEFEIIDLDNLDVKVGAPIADALGINDVILEIDNKSMTHRPDLWGHYGMAREVGALLSQTLSEYNPPEIKEGKIAQLKVDVKDLMLCPRYMGVVIDGVTVARSPEWLRKRLLSVGLRPLNNIVDITNYVMFDLGQPMHCFDASHLEAARNNKKETKIVVRKARNGEKIKALDEREYELNDEMLVIADAKKPVAIAGVIGGEETGVTEKTKTIVFESANFDPTSVRKTAAALGVRTDSSARFEKSLDPNMAGLALRRAVQLTFELCPDARVVSNIADNNNFQLNQGPIELGLDFVWSKMGAQIEKKQAELILERLGFKLKAKKNSWLVTVPSWRATKDISIPEDLVEEIARIYGYNAIPAELPMFSITPPPQDSIRMLERTVREILAYEAGFAETYNYSFVSPNWLAKMDIDTGKHIELDNPIAKDRPFVRRNLIPNLLENAESNLHRFDSVRLFEIGRTFVQEDAGERADNKGDELLPRQDTYLGLVYTSKEDETPFFGVSGAVARLCRRLGIEFEIQKKPPRDLFAHPGRYARICAGGMEVGWIAELHPRTQEKLGIPYRVGAAQINLNGFLAHAKEPSSYVPVGIYPAIDRDIAFVVLRDTEHADITRELGKIDSLISDVELFDVYEGVGVPLGKKSMAYHIIYRSIDHTLEATEVDTVHNKVAKVLKKKFGAEIR